MNEETRSSKPQDDWAERFQPMYAIKDEPIAEEEQDIEKTAVHPAHEHPTQVNARPAIIEQPPAVVPGPQAGPVAVKQPRKRRYPMWARAVIFVLGPVALVLQFMIFYMLLPPPPVDILVMGLDARPGEGYVTRTDSIMVLGVQPRWMRVNMLSIPRDLFIDVPGYGSQRINTVNVLGELEEEGFGPELLSDGIENSFGIKPDRYARLNFDAFVQLVDAVGGITINVPKAIVDYQYPTRDYGTMTVEFQPGRQHMDGERALIYARTRHADDDYGRADRQQQVLSALALKLANPLTWGPAMLVIQQNVDTNMSVLDMALYAPPFIFSAGRLDRLVINRDYIVGGSQGAVPNYEKLAPWISSRFN